jgi:opacity protein-like surface antigen
MLPRVLVAAATCLAASTSHAQPRAPIVRLVVDVRVASAGLPTAEGWTPVVPSGTVTPSRSLGLEAGAHVYLFRFRGGALGVGATWLMARGTTSAPEVAAEPATPTVANVPDVTTRLSSIVPQLSLNFGHSLGWSYLSAGLGGTKVESEAVLASSPIRFTPRNSDWVKTLNFGGGARWFLTDHLGVGFDLRWHKISLLAATPTRPGAPRASLLTAGAGVVLK